MYTYLIHHIVITSLVVLTSIIPSQAFRSKEFNTLQNLKTLQENKIPNSNRGSGENKSKSYHKSPFLKSSNNLYLLPKVPRGGAGNSDEDNIGGEADDSNSPSSAPPPPSLAVSESSHTDSTLWGSVSSAFQMNIDAKDELIRDSRSPNESDFENKCKNINEYYNEELICDGDIDAEKDTEDRGAEVEAEAGVEAEEPENMDVDTDTDDDKNPIEEEEVQYEENLLESQDENDNIPNSQTSTASSRFIHQYEEIDQDSSEEDIEKNYESESDDVENGVDSNKFSEDLEQTEIGIKIRDQSDEHIIDTILDNNVNVVATTESEDVSEDLSIDSDQESPATTESAGNNVAIYTQIDSSSSDSDLLLDGGEIKKSENADYLISATESEFKVEDNIADDSTITASVDYQSPTMEEIVREEWSMIPETENEDEGKENEIQVEEEYNGKKKKYSNQKDKTNRDKKEYKKKKDKNNKKKKNKDKKKKERERERELARDRKLSTKTMDQEPSMVAAGEPHAKIDASIGNQDIVKVQASDPASQNVLESKYISSGFWTTIDKVSSFGFSSSYESMRLSRKLRTIRKGAAYYTGLHGFISGKGREKNGKGKGDHESVELNEEDLGMIRRRIVAIEAARRRVASAKPDKNTILAARKAAYAKIPAWRRPVARLIRRPGNITVDFNDHTVQIAAPQLQNDAIIDREERQQSNLEPTSQTPSFPKPSMDQDPKEQPMSIEERERVKEIDRMIQDGQKRILELQIKKDALQRRPNPLYNYTTSKTIPSNPDGDVKENHREFNFPPENLVSEYIDELISLGRLQKMNHTDLWKRRLEIDEDDDIGDDLLTPSGDAKKLYENKSHKHGNGRQSNSGGGSWLLRQSLGAGSSLGEKIGESIENAAYKGVASAIMAILARSIAALHGVNVMQHSDIRLFVESAPDLPPVSKTMFQNNDYAKEAIGKAIRKGSKKKRKRKQKAYQYGSDSGDDSFVQRDAVVETLVSHCQISAPLLKLFPPAWQRMLLGNIITIVAATVSDFAEGVQFQILGHHLSFSFKPITEADMIQHIGVGGFRFNHRKTKPEEFEAAVRATANDISQGLGFLERWHERALGGDLLRAQIGNLIARVVLTLVDEVLHSARMDLWSAQVGGPRVVAGLEYRSAFEPNR